MSKHPVSRPEPDQKLPFSVLRSECDPGIFSFTTTDELSTYGGLIGQERALEAIKLAANIKHRDFNLYAEGPAGTGRHSAVESVLTKQAAGRPVPCDWAYVNNFDAAHKPIALRLPAGTAERLSSAMQDLVDDLANDIPALFEAEDYQTQRRAIDQEFGEKHETAFSEFAARARSKDVALLRTPVGFGLVALKNSEPVKPDAFQAMPEDEQKKINDKIEVLQNELATILQNMPSLEKEHRLRLEELHAAMAERAVSRLIGAVAAQFEGIEPVETYLQAVRDDMIANAELFLEATQNTENGAFPGAIRKHHRNPLFLRYAVNVMVSHSGHSKRGAPIIKEPVPTYTNLTGRIEHASEMGALITNFTMIKPGALHRANGGFLVLDAARVLSEPFAWEALKSCLDNRAISIISMADRLSLVSTTTLEPDPIPLDARVVLVGDRFLRQLLVMLDPSFTQLFKVQADFSEVMERSPKTLKQFARVIATITKREELHPLTPDGVARLLDQAVRIAEDAKRLSLNIGALIDILREADHYASDAGNQVISRAEIERAVDSADFRASRVRDRLQEMISRKTILIDTTGDVVGQINGLSVLATGTHRFGQPSRITARVRMGTGKVIDIEREVEMGGPLHSKGVLILSGYLASTFAQDVPMSLHASLVFEQSYGGVDGDSASSAELYALLSAISGVPIYQGFAVTGSVNQTGQVQAIGGVNDKIEGFFDVCKQRRLTGRQGVLIPHSNVEHLMLRHDVVDAVRDNKFHIFAVETIDQGISILTGIPAGKRGRNGHFPDDSINGRVETTLRSFAQQRLKFAKSADIGKKET